MLKFRLHATVFIALVLHLIGNATVHSQTLRVDVQFIMPRIIPFSSLTQDDFIKTIPIFRITLSNSSTENETVVFNFELRSQKFGSKPILVATTIPFQLKPGTHILTNIDISQRRSSEIRWKSIEFDREFAQKLQEELLRIGKLPNDIYRIKVELRAFQNNSLHAEDEETVRFSNPSRIDLLRPGRLAGRGNPVQIFTDRPQFQWRSNADEFILTVCEKEPTNSSPEDVMLNQPRARLHLKRGTDFFGPPNIVYPSVGVFPLMPGKTYYWQVEALVRGTGEKIRLPSEIWAFRVAKFDDVKRRMMTRNIFTTLSALLAGTPFSDVADPNGPFQGYLATGVVTLNGRRIDMADLNKLLARFAAEGNEIISVTIE